MTDSRTIDTVEAAATSPTHSQAETGVVPKMRSSGAHSTMSTSRRISQRMARFSQRFANERRWVALIQARSPEVALPPGAELEKLGEVGLRVLGLDAGEARSIARSFDWHSTLLIPVPMNAASFRKVTVRGRPGVLVTTTKPADGSERRRADTVLLWSEDDRVLGLVGNLSDPDMMQMAESVQ